MVFHRTAARLSNSVKRSPWIARQYRDPYVKKRLSDPAAYRSRSAFKLLEIDHLYPFLAYANIVLDLGAAPGGWSQVVAGKFGWRPQERSSKGVANNFVLEDSPTLWSDDLPLESVPRLGRKGTNPNVFDPLNIDNIDLNPHSGRGRGTIIATDLENISPILGVQTVTGDFLEESTQQIIRGLLFNAKKRQPKVDVILSDMAANITGNSVHDSQSSLEICEAVFDFAKQTLYMVKEAGKPRGGVLLMKYFSNPLLDKFREEILRPNFHKTFCIKPPSSRAASSETYFLCKGFRPLHIK